MTKGEDMTDEQQKVEVLHPEEGGAAPGMPVTYSETGVLPALRLGFEERMGNAVSRLEAALDRIAGNTEALAEEAEQAANESDKELRTFSERFHKRGV
jgi:hypothetical protein